MRTHSILRGRLGRALGLAALAAAALAGVMLLAGGLSSSRAAQGGANEPIPRTDDSVPLANVTMIGSSPNEANDETWGLGKLEEPSSKAAYGIVRYTPESGWTLGPALQDASGQPLKGFEPDVPSGLQAPSPLTGQLTPNGSGVLVGLAPDTEGNMQPRVLVRDPGGAFRETTPLVPEASSEALLREGERLFSTRRAPLVAPLEEAGDRAGALVVPSREGTEQAVLHWDGSVWTREPIEVPGNSEEEKENSGFQVVGIGASSPTNAWLLAQPSASTESLALYRRVEGVWKPVAGAPETPLTVGGEPLFTSGSPERVESQLLTVTNDGVWIDGDLRAAHALATAYFKPSGSLGGSITGSWCDSGEVSCQFSLPEDLPDVLPTGPSRSVAWANASAGPYGERVITGLKEGVSLRLEGSEFKRVLALGGSTAPFEDVGGGFGAAFSTAKEGWLGSSLTPVHLTLDVGAVQGHLAPWPVPFRHALFAIAPQPGQPVGALSSEALAVGDNGEVARYRPGQGWLPETLFGPGGRRETPRLRALAWPAPNRAYAVGDLGQMWLWRGETGLWEPDPATPLNFRGSLLGVAFDPNNPSRGYAVGSNGVLLRFGKTWTVESLPEAAQGAELTSIAFAGSEAIVAFNKEQNGNRVGGLLVNSGSGWSLDAGAASQMETGPGKNIPATVGTLADGGAAVATFGGPARVFEREGPGSGWQQTPAPLPPTGTPGSLALFREGGSVRVIASGTASVGKELIASPPPGFPPTLEEPAPVPTTVQQRGVVRQTAGGWSDEEHELNPVKEPPAPYVRYDSVYQPDPISAVLVDPSGSQGWAVGGFVYANNALDTADVDRYPSEGTPPPGAGRYEIPASSEEATFAVGGGAQCAAPCADRALAGIGPDVWLSNAFARAHETVRGLQAFLYTGPRLSTGQSEGSEPPYPFAHEFARYGELLAGAPLPVFAAASPTDLDARPLGGSDTGFIAGLAGAGLQESGLIAQVQGETAGDDQAYYAFSSTGPRGPVRVIVLDATGSVDALQLSWLQGELAAAAQRSEPALVVGNANLGAQVAAGNNPEADAVVAALVAGGASAYFYDSPEQNLTGALGTGECAVPAFGSGTLGYVAATGTNAKFEASGFLLAHVSMAPGTVSACANHRKVNVQLIPSIGELALEAGDGTLLRRSQPALFTGLGRRPRAGNRSQRGSVTPDTNPYIQFPSECVGTACPLAPTYEFTSSNEEVGQFVKRNLASPDQHAVEVNEAGTTIPDAQSGLFCAYKEGETTVTIRSGGEVASLQVKVQAGSARRPCVPPNTSSQLASQSSAAPAPPPAPAPTPAGPAPASSPPVVPVPVPPLPAAPLPPAAQRTPATPNSFFLPPPLPTPLLAFVPPPVPSPARPSPPSGTSAVTSPVEVAEHEEDEEEATESVSNQAVAYRAHEHEPSPLYILGIVALAALAGAGARRGRRSRGHAHVAPATLTTMHTQRRMTRNRRFYD